jgi:RNA polymerase sigma factor (sigma-70 family)
MVANALSDQQLIAGYLEGNHARLQELIVRHQTKVYSYIYMVVRDKELAEDIFQDTFIKVINTIRSGFYKEEGKFIQWVMRIAHNLIIDHFRKSKRIPVVENNNEYNIFDNLKVYDDSIEKKLIKEQIYEDLKKLIDLLPEEQREVLILRHYAGMSFKEISELTNVSINTALGRMRYALINMRKMIEQNAMIMSE